MSCKVCQRKIIKAIEFRYTCSGCQGIFCDKHLEIKFGHQCSGYERKMAEQKEKLIGTMPKVVKPQILSL